MKHFALLVTCALLSGCSSLDRTRPTMASDDAELGFEGLVYQNELSLAYVRFDANENKLCDAFLPSFQEKDKWSYSRYNKPGKTTADQFRCVHFRRLEPGEEGVQQIARHVQAGLALSKLYCENYFDRISLHVGKRTFWQALTNDAGAAISAVLGLSNAGVKVTSGVGVGFGLADGIFRNYNGQFVVGPDLAIVRNAVLAAQTDKRTSILGNMPTNFADANTAILEHAKTCSFLGMKGLINDRVATSPTSSRQALVEYVAKFQITQEDIEKEVAAKRKAQEEAEAKAKAAKEAEEAARKAGQNKAP
jgi:hypothetical protein